MIDLNEVKKLIDLTSGQPVLSLYLQVDGSLEENQAEKPAWRIHAKNVLKEISESVAAEHADAWATVKERAQTQLMQYLDKPAGKGLVLFISPSVEQVYLLPVLPESNEHHWGEIMVAPLLWLLDEYERYLIVLVDTEEAHFLTTYLGNIDRQEAMASDRFTFEFREKTIMPRPTGIPADTGATTTAGSHRDSFENKIDDYIARFHQDVADRVREVLRDTGTARVVIGGTESAAHAVKSNLHDSVRAALVGVLPIPMQEADQEVMNRVLPHALKYERAKEAELIEHIVNQAHAGGRSVIGPDAV
ncbi:MAG: VLRF1 family aeRF1-type release factor, partial [Chloroflexota bacterium]